jgi:hypothetical protein
MSVGACLCVPGVTLSSHEIPWTRARFRAAFKIQVKSD